MEHNFFLSQNSKDLLSHNNELLTSYSTMIWVQMNPQKILTLISSLKYKFVSVDSFHSQLPSLRSQPKEVCLSFSLKHMISLAWKEEVELLLLKITHGYIHFDRWWHDWNQLLLLLVGMAKKIDAWPIVLLKFVLKTHTNTHIQTHSICNHS